VKALEVSLVIRTPAKLAIDTSNAIVAQARTLNLKLLHAVSCAAQLQPVDAIRRHLAEVDATDESVRLAARKAKGPDLVSAALEHEDAVTLALAAQAVATAPALLKRINVASPRWRAIWRSALELDRGAALGPADPVAATTALLEGLVDGSIVDMPLIAALSSTALADLSKFPDREELWPKLSDPALSAYLAATANGWLEAVERGDAVATEQVLAHIWHPPNALNPRWSGSRPCHRSDAACSARCRSSTRRASSDGCERFCVVPIP
jgi:hypothetical protein